MRSLAYFIGTFAVALLLGIGSAWYMIEQGSPLTTTKVGPWASWNALGNPTADPYTKAHLARSGRLPLSSTVARYFVARTDGSGHGLTSGCEYLVTGSPINARWWSIALYDDTGSLIENASKQCSRLWLHKRILRIRLTGIDVGVGRHDIVVPSEHDRCVEDVKLVGVCQEPLHPGELEFEFWSRLRVAVGRI